MKYAGLSINEIIMHELVKKTEKGASPLLSDVPSPMSDENRAYIQARIRTVLADARPIVEESGLSSVPSLMRDLLVGNGDTDLVGTSRSVASALQSCQPTVSPGGIFVFADAFLDSQPAVLIAKLEHERGVRAYQTVTDDGSTTFEIRLLQDLLFTTGSKVFKAAIFPTLDGSGILHGSLVDKQMAGSSIAQYFIGEFLGCRLDERPDLHTQRFFDSAQSWINKETDIEKKTRYELALLSDLQSQRTTLSADRFASEHLDVDDRDDFVSSVQVAGVPAREIPKDLKLVRTKLAKMRIETASGVVLTVPPDAVERGIVTIERARDDVATIVVRDKLLKVGGSGSIRTTPQDSDASHVGVLT